MVRLGCGASCLCRHCRAFHSGVFLYVVIIIAPSFNDDHRKENHISVVRSLLSIGYLLSYPILSRVVQQKHMVNPNLFTPQGYFIDPEELLVLRRNIISYLLLLCIRTEKNKMKHAMFDQKIPSFHHFSSFFTTFSTNKMNY